MRRGYTLIDLLMVMLVLGLVAMLVLPGFQADNPTLELRRSSTELVAGLEYARSLAIRYERPFAVKVDAAKNEFHVKDTDPQPNGAPPAQPGNLPPVNNRASVLDPIGKDWYENAFPGGPGHAGAMVVTGGEIWFYPDGSASVSTGVVLKASGEQWTINVDPRTGGVRVN